MNNKIIIGVVIVAVVIGGVWFMNQTKQPAMELGEDQEIDPNPIPVGGPDLIPDSLDWVPGSVTAGGDATIAFRVKNVGNQAAGAFHLIITSTDGSGALAQKCTWDVPSLQPGEIFARGYPGDPGSSCSGRAAATTQPVPYGIVGAAASGYWTTFVVDDTGTVQEANEANNTRSVCLPVNGACPQKPQATAPAPAPSPSPISAPAPVPAQGAVKEFTVTASNFSFSLKEMRVQEGDRVRLTLKNSGGMHDWRLDEFDGATKVLQSGEEQTVEFVASKAGTFEYYCSVGKHRQMGMVGKLIVE